MKSSTRDMLWIIIAPLIGGILGGLWFWKLFTELAK